MNNTPADKLFEILSFQYKPLEKKMLADLKEDGRDDILSMYKHCSTAKKIAVLDIYASAFNL
jgi:hypothetical protein